MVRADSPHGNEGGLSIRLFRDDDRRNQLSQTAVTLIRAGTFSRNQSSCDSATDCLSNDAGSLLRERPLHAPHQVIYQIRHPRRVEAPISPTIEVLSLKFYGHKACKFCHQKSARPLLLSPVCQELPTHRHSIAFKARMNQPDAPRSTPELISQSVPASETSTRAGSVTNLVGSDSWPRESYRDSHGHHVEQHAVISGDVNSHASVVSQERWAADSFVAPSLDKEQQVDTPALASESNRTTITVPVLIGGSDIGTLIGAAERNTDDAASDNASGCEDTNIARHVCTVPDCNKTFSTPAHLSRHAKLHGGTKPHKCLLDMCSKTFTRRDNMMVHYRAHARKLGIVEMKDRMLSSMRQARHHHHSYLHPATLQHPMHDHAAAEAFAAQYGGAPHPHFYNNGLVAPHFGRLTHFVPQSNQHYAMFTAANAPSQAPQASVRESPYEVRPAPYGPPAEQNDGSSHLYVYNPAMLQQPLHCQAPQQGQLQPNATEPLKRHDFELNGLQSQCYPYQAQSQPQRQHAAPSSASNEIFRYSLPSFDVPSSQSIFQQTQPQQTTRQASRLSPPSQASVINEMQVSNGISPSIPQPSQNQSQQPHNKLSYVSQRYEMASEPVSPSLASRISFNMQPSPTINSNNPSATWPQVQSSNDQSSYIIYSNNNQNQSHQPPRMGHLADECTETIDSNSARHTASRQFPIF
ncbi:hypothetical protein SeMB42_g00986 [Synchytrium endobioticum]|uniref:C2H2-type domain-containing protein n=2 Tax=Synchytrium endobioticum TaxID=286115 RepID=A0A507DPE3_9FUNG|nr:hypothetical protein SeMB42_g00986 [Synchytrium endobioticum]